jgi:energy-coupling factor transporter ATP-binding protein EcfA2
MRGKFVTFEGIEGSGKSTQVKLLISYLEKEGIPYLKTREPGGTPIAEAIRKILLDPACKEMLPETELLLYNASRCQHTGELIIPALEAGKLVICDRYFDSTYAYQGPARELDEGHHRYLNSYATFNTVQTSRFCSISRRQRSWPGSKNALWIVWIGECGIFTKSPQQFLIACQKTILQISCPGWFKSSGGKSQRDSSSSELC